MQRFTKCCSAMQYDNNVLLPNDTVQIQSYILWTMLFQPKFPPAVGHTFSKCNLMKPLKLPKICFKKLHEIIVENGSTAVLICKKSRKFPRRRSAPPHHGTTLPTFTGVLPRSEKKLPTLAKPRWVVFPSSNFQVSRPKIEI